MRRKEERRREERDRERERERERGEGGEKDTKTQGLHAHGYFLGHPLHYQRIQGLAYDTRKMNVTWC